MKRPPDGPSKTKDEEEEREHPAIAQVRCMMGRELRIRIVDGRVFTGRFECYDKQGNILMDNAMSTVGRGPGGYGAARLPRDDRHTGAAQGGHAPGGEGRRERPIGAGL